MKPTTYALIALACLSSTRCHQPAPAAPRAASTVTAAPPSSPSPTQARNPAVAEPVAAPVREQRPNVPTPTEVGVELVEVLVGEVPAGQPRLTIVAIHGLGDTPEDFVEWLRSVPVPARIYAPRGILPFGSGDGRAWWTPGSGDEAAIARAVDTAADAIARASSGKVQGNTVCGQPIVLGFSQGAMLTFALAQRASPAWRMAIPIAGRIPPGSRVGARNAVKIRAMHGTTDDRIPLAGGRAAVDGLRARGFDATLRTFNGVAHSIPMEVQREVFRTIEEEARAMGCVR